MPRWNIWILGGLSFCCQLGKPEEAYCGIITRLITCDLQSWVMHSVSSSWQQNKCKTGRPRSFYFSRLLPRFSLFFPLALSLPVLIALPHLCWFYLRWWLFDACTSESHPYSVHRAVRAKRRCSFFILSLCLSSSPSVLSRGSVTFNPCPCSLISSAFSTAQGHREAQLERTALAQCTLQLSYEIKAFFIKTHCTI